MDSSMLARGVAFTAGYALLLPYAFRIAGYVGSMFGDFGTMAAFLLCYVPFAFGGWLMHRSGAIDALADALRGDAL